MKKLVILDRDGVINEESNLHIKSPDEWKAIPGSLESIARLNQAGYRVVIATNQSGLSRGLFDIFTLNKIHNKMYQEAAFFGAKIDAIFFCQHQPDDCCSCRKPKPGLITEAIERYRMISCTEIPFVGDSICDIEAAIAGKIQPWLVLTGNGMKTLKKPTLASGVKIARDLSAFTNQFLSKKK